MNKYPTHCPKLGKYILNETSWHFTRPRLRIRVLRTARWTTDGTVSNLTREVDIIIWLWILKIYDVLFGVYTIFTQISEFSSKRNFIWRAFLLLGTHNQKPKWKIVDGSSWRPGNPAINRALVMGIKGLHSLGWRVFW